MSLFFKPSAQTGTTIITNGLVSRYTFEDTGTTTLTDVAGSNDMTINGMTYGSDSTGRPTSVTGSNHGVFDGVDDNVIYSGSTASPYPNGFTVVLWQYRTDSHGKSTISEIGGDTTNPDRMRYLRANQFASYKVSFKDASSSFVGPSWGSSQSGKWVLMAVGISGSGGVTAYAKYEASGSTTTDTTSFSISYNGFDNKAWQFGDGAGGTPFGGRIDDVRIYERELSASEITDIYNGSG